MASASSALSLHYTPFVLPLLGAAGLCFALAILAWLRRHVPGGAAFAFLMLAIGEWSATYALELAGTDLSTKLFFDQLEYLGIVANPIGALIFALHYTGRGRWLVPWRRLALALVPATTLALLWTNPTNGAVQAAVRLDSSGPFPSLVITHGPWFWVNVAYSYLLLAAAGALLWESLLRSPRLFRSQVGALLLAILAPFLGNVVYLAGGAPVPHLDLTPFAFTVTGLAMFVAFFRLGLLERFLGLPLFARSILLSRLPDGVIVADSRGTIVEANPAALEILGQPEIAVLGRPVAAYFPDWVGWAAGRRDVRPSRVEVRLGSAGVPGFYDVLLAPEYLGGKHLIGWILVLRDISERKRIEDSLHQSERRFRLLIERSTDVFLILRADGIVRYASPSAQSVLGYTPEDLFGTSSLSFVHPDDVARAIEALRGIVREPGAASSLEIRCRRADGTWRWFESVGVNLLDEPAVAGIVATIRDVTERKRMEAEREEALAREQAARAQAEEAVRLRDDFLSIAAHELKTPVTSLRLAAQALPRVVDRGLPVGAPQFRRALQTIDQQSVKLTHLVLQLLEISRLRLGRLVLNRTRENLADLVRGVVDQAQARTAAHALSASAPAEVVAFVDALRVEQVLTNLLDNAIKYSPDGGPIDVALEQTAPEWVALTVRDRGLGIPPERRDHIFDLFYQAHLDSHQSGMGVGLFIVRQIVELHGGQIRAEFPPDGGSRFRVNLPVVPAAPTGSQVNQEDEQALSDAPEPHAPRPTG